MTGLRCFLNFVPGITEIAGKRFVSSGWVAPFLSPLSLLYAIGDSLMDGKKDNAFSCIVSPF